MSEDRTTENRTTIRWARWTAARLAAGAARPVQWVATLLTAAAGGVLGRDELRESIADVWSDVARAEDGETSGLHPWEAEFYAAHLPAGGRVLLVACGSGRDLVPLIERGHEVAGLDLSAPSIEAARARLARRGLAAELIAAAIEDAPLPGAFDAVVFSWLSYGYLPGADARSRALRRAGAALRPGGRVLVSYPLRGATSRWPSRAARLAAWLARSDWTPQHGDVFIPSRHDRRLQLHYEHHFAPEEFLAEARAAGLAAAFHDARGVGRAVLTPPGPA